MKNVIVAILSSNRTKPQKQDSRGRKTGAIAVLPPPTIAAHSCFCSDPFPNESKELVPTFRKLLFVALFSTSGARILFGVLGNKICTLVQLQPATASSRHP